MPKFIICYKIENAHKNPEGVTDWYNIHGYMCVKYMDVILTKSYAEGDDGYLGNWIFEEIFNLISTIPQLMRGERCVVDIEEEFTGFFLEPKNNQVYFSVIPMHLEPKIAEQEIHTYPYGPKGYPIPAKLFYNGVIDLGHRFFNDIIERYSNFNKEEMEKYGELLKSTEELVEKCNNTHYGHLDINTIEDLKQL
jgi:hypothetical protein